MATLTVIPPQTTKRVIEKDPLTGRKVEYVYSSTGERLGGRYLEPIPPAKALSEPKTTKHTVKTSSGETVERVRTEVKTPEGTQVTVQDFSRSGEELRREVYIKERGKIYPQYGYERVQTIPVFEPGKEVPVSAGVAKKLGRITEEEYAKEPKKIYVVRPITSDIKTITSPAKYPLPSLVSTMPVMGQSTIPVTGKKEAEKIVQTPLAEYEQLKAIQEFRELPKEKQAIVATRRGLMDIPGTVKLTGYKILGKKEAYEKKLGEILTEEKAIEKMPFGQRIAAVEAKAFTEGAGSAALIPVMGGIMGKMPQIVKIGIGTAGTIAMIPYFAEPISKREYGEAIARGIFVGSLVLSSMAFMKGMEMKGAVKEPKIQITKAREMTYEGKTYSIQKGKVFSEGKERGDITIISKGVKAKVGIETAEEGIYKEFPKTQGGISRHYVVYTPKGKEPILFKAEAKTGLLKEQTLSVVTTPEGEAKTITGLKISEVLVWKEGKKLPIETAIKYVSAWEKGEKPSLGLWERIKLSIIKSKIPSRFEQVEFKPTEPIPIKEGITITGMYKGKELGLMGEKSIGLTVYKGITIEKTPPPKQFLFKEGTLSLSKLGEQVGKTTLSTTMQKPSLSPPTTGISQIPTPKAKVSPSAKPEGIESQALPQIVSQSQAYFSKVGTIYPKVETKVLTLPVETSEEQIKERISQVMTIGEKTETKQLPQMKERLEMKMPEKTLEREISKTMEKLGEAQRMRMRTLEAQHYREEYLSKLAQRLITLESLRKRVISSYIPTFYTPIIPITSPFVGEGGWKRTTHITKRKGEKVHPLGKDYFEKVWPVLSEPKELRKMFGGKKK